MRIRAYVAGRVSQIDFKRRDAEPKKENRNVSKH